MATKSKYENLFFALRVLLAALLFGAVLIGIGFVVDRSYPTIGEWKTAGNHDAFVLDGVTYRRVGELQEKNDPKIKDYGVADLVGRVADADTQAESVSETAAMPGFSQEQMYPVYSVKEKEHVLILRESDDTMVLYREECAAWVEADDTAALVYEEKTYLLVGIVGGKGLPSEEYVKRGPLGLVRNDLMNLDLTDADEDTVERAKHLYTFYSVERYAHLLIVDGDDKKSYLYCQEGTPGMLEIETETEAESAD